ncbi:MAG TPA: tRNA-(ms[2]io[6]A)-hydroxylase [bacterium]|nr:tRNA-(ms[2]io[6]A)-hydroxylase [bacterium]
MSISSPDTSKESAAGLRLRAATTGRWLQAVERDFDAFLVDHAACERKAMSTGMLFVVRYPDREALLETMIEFAREELEHFQELVRLLLRRGLRPGADVEDEYAGHMQKLVRHGRDERLLDRLLVSAIFEARGCERFGMLATHLPQGEEREMYRRLTRADARHQRTFLELAAHYFSNDAIEARLAELLDAEARIVSTLAPAPSLYSGA